MSPSLVDALVGPVVGEALERAVVLGRAVVLPRIRLSRRRLPWGPAALRRLPAWVPVGLATLALLPIGPVVILAALVWLPTLVAFAALVWQITLVVLGLGPTRIWGPGLTAFVS